MREVLLQDDLAALLQHEVDHLDGILATMRAAGDKAFFSASYVQRMEGEDEEEEAESLG